MDARLILAALLLWLPLPVLALEHDAWDALLKKHVVVQDGGYLDSLSRIAAGEFEAWPQPEQMAVLNNAYNAFTVEKILTRYPDIRSIWDFGKLFGNPFKDEFFVLLGSRRSLDWIEHETLRKRYRDPRIHYAVNCASVGCPMLREKAYVASRLEAQLDEQARRFLSDRSRNRLRDGRLEVSRIFDWFKQDFAPREAYFAGYAERLLDYDWSLNDAGR